MQLEKIEMSGFKSFADKTVIEFDKGVTAVVGPNGSGKSNLSEAIKWVLGEQSAKSLRGKKMDDVIFAGSQTRKPVNIAEVKLYIANEDGALAIDSEQVVLTRRLSRSGESQFFINKKPCRLKDITNLMMDSGLGKDSFALISQGKVEQIFNDKPEDRRMIIEEAAGVLKYKDRKVQAQRKLDQTQEHLNRVEDILHEIHGQMEPLSQQRDKAIVYLSKKEELQNIETALLAVEIETLNSQWTVAKQEVSQLQEEIAETENRLTLYKEKVSTVQEQLTQTTVQLDQKQHEYVMQIQKMEQLDGERKVYLQKRDFAKRSDAENQTVLQDLLQELEQLEVHIEELNRQLYEKKAEEQQIQQQWQQLVTELEQLSQSDEEKQKELQSQYIEKLQEISRLTNQEKNLERLKEQHTQSQQKMQERMITLQKQESESIAKIQSLETKKAELQAQQETMDGHSSKQQETLDQATKTREESLLQHQKIERQLQQTQATYRSLKQISEDYAGYYQGVREVLKHKQQLQGVVGSVAELIRVEDSYTIAIDIALGASSQHIVVEQEDSAAKSIEFLKKNRLGRATFLPMTVIRPKYVTDAVLHRASSMPGFIAVASELVQVQPQYQAIVQSILGTTFVTETLQHAMSLAKALDYRYRIVTLEGDVANAGGSMTGGASKNHQQQSLVKRTSQLESLEKQLQQLQHYFTMTKSRLEEAEKHWVTVSQEMNTAKQETQSIQQEMQSLEMQLSFAKEELTKQSRARKAQEFEWDELQEQMDTNQAKLKQTTYMVSALEKDTRQLKQELDVMQLSLEDRTQQIQERQQQLQTVGTTKARIEEQRHQLQKELQQQQQQLKRLKQQEELLHSKHHETSQEQAMNEEQFKQIQSALLEMQQFVQKLDDDITRLKEQRSNLDIELKQSETNRNQTQQHLQEQMRQQSKVETKANRFEIAIDAKLTYLSEEYELTFEAAIAKTELTMAIDEAAKQVRQLKQQIEQMGAVNVLAIEEYDKIQERYTFLSDQQTDLLEAKKNLEDTIEEMDSEVTMRFKETFDAISTQFEKTFPRLFGGGRAALELTNPENLLETGIEIIAQPPGKKLQSLSLLSGGERAFTAIALLFAILEVKPVPFCLLDEVEAALDEANVARYGRYLKEFTKNTQFIVITHRRGTMEEADVLYGVTMQESGVSKLASVKFEDFTELQ